MKKISEVQPIEKSGTTIITRENLRDFIEEPLVEVVESLYDKNILTYMASANRKDVDGSAYLSFYYDKLSEENKKIIQQKIEEEIAGYEIVDENLIGTVVRLSMPITEQTTVDEVKKFFLNKISDFRIQDLQCQKYESKTEIIEAYFKYIQLLGVAELRAIHDFFKENPEMENESNPSFVVEEDSYDYESALNCLVEELGFVYCDEESTLYENEEDLRRHRHFLESRKSELGKREEELSSLEAEAKKIYEAEALIDQQKEGQDMGEE